MNGTPPTPVMVGSTHGVDTELLNLESVLSQLVLNYLFGRHANCFLVWTHQLSQRILSDSLIECRSYGLSDERRCDGFHWRPERHVKLRNCIGSYSHVQRNI